MKKERKMWKKWLTVYLVVDISFVVVACFGIGVSPPHIILILADDLGWNDVSFHNSLQISTPNIDALAASGIVLQNFYAGPHCSASRGSLMTGKYSSNIGLQHDDISCGQPYGLPLDLTIMPEYLTDLGYATHMVGKWQLGYFNKSYTPTNRGFDDFFGCLNGQIDYYDYTLLSNNDDNIYWGIDLNDGEKILKDFRGQYLTDLLTDRAIHIIQEHSETQPLFLFLSHIAVHVGNSYSPLQAPPKNVAKYDHINDLFRRIFAGMVSKLDDSVGEIFHALSDKGFLDNSIIVFFSDNGGVTQLDPYGTFSSNWPFRGGKKTLWEGGIRVPALIWSPLLELEDPLTSYQLMHVTDWLPTLYKAAGGRSEELGRLDGIDMWEALKKQLPSPRSEILFQLDANFSMGAIRIGDYKLVKGSYPGGDNGWYGSFSTEGPLTNMTLDDWVWKDGCVIKDILEKSEWWLIKSADSWRNKLFVNCSGSIPSDSGTCDSMEAPCLFNIVRDPCEKVNLASRHPKIVKSMLRRLKFYEESAMTPLTVLTDSKSDPRCHEFAYVSWMDPNNPTQCPSN